MLPQKRRMGYEPETREEGFLRGWAVLGQSPPETVGGGLLSQLDFPGQLTSGWRPEQTGDRAACLPHDEHTAATLHVVTRMLSLRPAMSSSMTGTARRSVSIALT